MLRVLAFVVLGALTLASAAAEGAVSPSIRPVAIRPLTVEGANFGAGEKVTVLVTTPLRFATRHVVASTEGSFHVRFAGLDASGSGLRIRAIGSQGHAAIWSSRAARISPPTT